EVVRFRGDRSRRVSAAEADGEPEVGPLDGAVDVLGLGDAAVEDVGEPLPRIARADLEAVDLVGEAETGAEERRLDIAACRSGFQCGVRDRGRAEGIDGSEEVAYGEVAGAGLALHARLLFSEQHTAAQ